VHIGFRYHVATLMAVFFSLFLGILVGSIIFQDDLIVQEQNSIINELENKFTKLQASLKEAQTKEALLTEGWDLIRSALIAERLQGRHVVLFTVSEHAAPVKRLTAVLKEAGAQVAATYRWPSDADGLDTLKASLAELNLDQPIAVAWIDQDYPSLVKDILDYLQASAWQVCILQPFTSRADLAAYAQNALVIDIGDTYLGELAMVWGLSAGATGVYGHSSAAAALLPDLIGE